jgi:uncharacterized membrane protein YhaH (DUF805 family)
VAFGQLFFGFQGRIRRLHYWGASLAQCVLAALAAFVIEVWFPRERGAPAEPAAMALLAILYVVALWSSLAVQIKRWHDRDKNGVWVLINLIPILGGIWALVENGFLDGTQGPNQYGASPKGIGEVAPSFG